MFLRVLSVLRGEELFSRNLLYKSFMQYNGVVGLSLRSTGSNAAQPGWNLQPLSFVRTPGFPRQRKDMFCLIKTV